MSGTSGSGNPYHFKPVSPGEPVTADWANSLVAMINSLSSEVIRLRSLLDAHLYQRLDALVELTSDLSMGGQANAKVLCRDTDPNTWTDAATREITVYDAIGNLEATAGSRFIARYLRQQGIWIVLGNAGGSAAPPTTSSTSSVSWPNVITFQLDDTLAETDSSTVVTRTHFWSGNSDDPIELAGPITLTNPQAGEFTFSGEEDAGGIAIYSGTPGYYIILNMECS